MFSSVVHPRCPVTISKAFLEILIQKALVILPVDFRSRRAVREPPRRFAPVGSPLTRFSRRSLAPSAPITIGSKSTLSFNRDHHANQIRQKEKQLYPFLCIGRKAVLRL
jgi:hypothetical protein